MPTNRACDTVPPQTLDPGAGAYSDHGVDLSPGSGSMEVPASRRAVATAFHRVQQQNQKLANGVSSLTFLGFNGANPPVGVGPYNNVKQIDVGPGIRMIWAAATRVLTLNTFGVMVDGLGAPIEKPNYLASKLAAGSNVTFAISGDGINRVLTINSTAVGGTNPAALTIRNCDETYSKNRTALKFSTGLSVADGTNGAEASVALALHGDGEGITSTDGLLIDVTNGSPCTNGIVLSVRGLCFQQDGGWTGLAKTLNVTTPLSVGVAAGVATLGVTIPPSTNSTTIIYTGTNTVSTDDWIADQWLVGSFGGTNATRVGPKVLDGRDWTGKVVRVSVLRRTAGAWQELSIAFTPTVFCVDPGSTNTVSATFDIMSGYYEAVITEDTDGKLYGSIHVSNSASALNPIDLRFVARTFSPVVKTVKDGDL